MEPPISDCDKWNGGDGNEEERMVPRPIYCVEQISIPESFPNILKMYAKDVIKTQPYDLLRWSLEYFRCLQMGVPPPVKKRLEKTMRYGTLTRGYLKILLDQIGKGYYVNRDVLQKKWQGLCLPEDELLKFLSLCRMYNWSQIHWLKLFAVMVASLNNNLRESIFMLVELLTDEVEGSPSPIPMWMLNVCYTFVAELDCSLDMEFRDGRLVLPSGELENESIVPEGPKILSSIGFRDAVVDEWKRRLDEISVGSNDLGSLREGIVSIPDAVATPDKDISEKALVNTTLKFSGNYNNPFDLIRRTPDYESIIVYLDGMRFQKDRKYDDGENQCIDRNFDQTTKREKEILLKYSKVCEAYNERTKKFMEEEKAELLKKIGSPWSWLHSFASQNSRDSSYNFIELDDEMYNSSDNESDYTDGSLDLENEQPNELKMKKVEEKEKLDTVDSIIREVVANVCEAEEDGMVTVSENKSILSFMSDISNYEFSEDKHRIVDFGPLKKYIEDAEKDGLKFKDLDELHDYFIQKCADEKITSSILKYKIFGEKIDYGEDQVEKEKPQPSPLPVVKEKEKKVKKIIGPKESNPKIDEVKIDEEKIERIFLESGIEVDQRVLTKQISDNMILGLAIDGPCPTTNPTPDSTVCDEESKHDTGSELSTDLNQSATAIYSDTSSKISKQPAESAPKKKKRKSTKPIELIEPVISFNCTILAIPGIGSSVSKKTILDFLTYCKYRSRRQRGMIYPRNFKENECPHMTDVYD